MKSLEMKKKVLKRNNIRKGILGVALLATMLAVAGCGGGKAEESSTEEVQEPLYPVSINGKEIRVGETTVQALLDDGFKVTVSEMTPDKQINEYEIDPEEELEANSYYSGGSMWITDSTFAHISMVTGEDAVRMGDAVIARLEFHLSTDDAENDGISFDGVAVNEISREKAGEMFPDFQGDENMWFSSGLKEYDYFMSFDVEKMLYTFSVEKKYDVDWNG